MVKKWKSTLLAVGLELLLSVLATLTLFTTSELAKKGINAPASQCFLYYLLLALFSGGIMLYTNKPHKEKLNYYIWLSLVDVSANFFAWCFWILDNWTIVCAMLLVWLFFKEKIEVRILVGIAICVASYAIVFISDAHSVQWIRSSAKDLLTGDMLIIVGATLSGVSFVIEDFILTKDDWVTRSAFVGIFGAILTAPQIVIYERSDFKSILSSPLTIFLVIEFSLSMFFIYLGPHFFYKEIEGSIMLSLPILVTCHIWVILICIFVYHEKVDWMYFVAVATVTLGFGLILFSRKYKIDSSNEEADLGRGRHSNNVGISNKNGHKISSVEYVTCPA